MEKDTMLNLDVYINLFQLSRSKLYILIKMLNVNLEQLKKEE